jgi:hypothetical protein
MKKLVIGIILTLVLSATAVPLFAFAANGQGTLDHVTISPDSAVVVPGGAQQFTAKSYDANNHALTGVTYVWQVVAGGGTMDMNTGYFTAGSSIGTYTDSIKVTASKSGVAVTDLATVIVANHGDLYDVVISPETATIQPLGTQQFSAVAKDAFGTEIITGISYLWQIVNLGGAIDPTTGLFTAGTATSTFENTVQVTAAQAVTLITKSDTATVKVARLGDLDSVTISPDEATVLVGDSKQFSVAAKDAFNNDISTGVTCAWTVTGSGNEIDITGKFTADSTPGTYTITVTATQSGTGLMKSDIATVTVIAEEEELEGSVPPGWSHGRKAGWHGSTTPPGWSKGNKTGWNGKDSPPGLLNMKNGDQNDED